MSAGRASSRHRSREVALQVLYAIDLGEGRSGAEAPTAEGSFQTAEEHFELPEGARVFAKELVAGVIAQL